MQIKDVMTSNPEVVDVNSPVQTAAITMRDLNVGSLPVCDGEKLCGVITDRDIAVRLVAESLDPSNTSIQDIMTPEVAYCFEDDLVHEATALMEAHQIRRLPILNRGKQLVGILSLGDLAVRTLGTEDQDLVEDTLEEISEPAEPKR